MSEANVSQSESVGDGEQFVSKKAYSEVQADMLKYKSEMRTLKAELDRVKIDEDARKEAEAIKNGEFQKLADSYRLKFEEAEAKRVTEARKVVEFQKLTSLDRELGGFQRPEYAKIAANLEAIRVDDSGLIDVESLKSEVARIKQEHPALLKNVAHAKLPNQKTQSENDLTYTEALKKCKTKAELEELMRKHNRL